MSAACFSRVDFFPAKKLRMLKEKRNFPAASLERYVVSNKLNTVAVFFSSLRFVSLVVLLKFSFVSLFITRFASRPLAGILLPV